MNTIHRPVLKNSDRKLNTELEKTFSLCNPTVLLFLIMILSIGELYRLRNPWHHGPETQYPEHVRDCSRWPRQVHFDGFLVVQGRYYCFSQSWRNQSNRYKKRRTRKMYHHQVNVSSPLIFLKIIVIMMNNTDLYRKIREDKLSHWSKWKSLVLLSVSNFRY